MHSLTIFITAYNEEEALGKYLPGVIEFCSRNGYRLVVVNDGSADGTRRVLDSFANNEVLTVLHHKVNRGYGGAIKTGIQQATTDYVITIDADGQHNLEDVTRMLKLVQETDADMVVGNRKGPSASAYRSFGKWLIRKLARMLMPVKITDLNSGIKLYSTKLAQRYLVLCPDSMAYSDIIALVFISQRHLVMELPVTINPRIAGKSTISTKTAVQTVLEIIHIVMLFNPLRVFLPLSIICTVAGLAWGLPFLLQGKGVSIGALLGIVTGGLLFLLGLLAEQLSMIRKNQVTK